MDGEAGKEVVSFCEQLVRLNGTMKELFASGNVALFSEMNRAIKEMYALQHGSGEKAFAAVEAECRIVYENFDMLIAVLRTTENGVIDKGAQKALNHFVHNIDEAVVNIAAAFGII